MISGALLPLIILLALLVGLGVGFAVGRRTATPGVVSGSQLAVQQALDAQKAQLAHALASHRQKLGQLESSVALIRRDLEDGSRELLGELPPVRAEVSRLQRPESSDCQPRDYSDGASGLLSRRKESDNK